MLGIQIIDEFTLTEIGEGRVQLTIDSRITPRGMKGKLMHLLLGRRLDKMMIEEWESASKALISESSQSSR